jgi:hypothetical protein
MCGESVTERLKERLSSFFALRVMNIKEAPLEYGTAMRLKHILPVEFVFPSIFCLKT